LLDRAEAADAHWVSRVTGLRDSTTPTSFRGLYAAAYRRFSAIAHPTNLGLNPVTVDLDGSHKRVQPEERPPDMRGPFGLATIAFALGPVGCGRNDRVAEEVRDRSRPDRLAADGT
jgi:hypothetical protein